MLNILALILITLCVPAITYVGIKIYKPTNGKKLLIFFTLLFLGLDLLRFFYTASLYPNAVIPAADLRFSYLALLCIFALFATFNTGKFGNLLKNIFVLTALAPLVLALFNSGLYTNALDTHAVIKAAYFVETGVVVTLAMLYVLFAENKFSALNALWGALTMLGFALINCFANWYWKTGVQFNLMWFLTMLACVLAVGLSYLAYYLYAKFSKKPESVKEAND